MVCLFHQEGGFRKDGKELYFSYLSRLGQLEKGKKGRIYVGNCVLSNNGRKIGEGGAIFLYKEKILLNLILYLRYPCYFMHFFYTSI